MPAAQRGTLAAVLTSESPSWAAAPTGYEWMLPGDGQISWGAKKHAERWIILWVRGPFWKRFDCMAEVRELAPGADLGLAVVWANDIVEFFVDGRKLLAREVGPPA